MPFNPKDLADVQKLSAAVGYSYGVLKPFRINRQNLLREYVGKNYSDNGATDRVPINLIELAMNIYLQRLVANDPAVAVTSQFPKLQGICA